MLSLDTINKEVRDKLSKINAKIGGWNENFDPFYGAPVVLIVLADKNWFTGVYDGSLVIANLFIRRQPCYGKSHECSRKSWRWKHLDSQSKRRI